MMMRVENIARERERERARSVSGFALQRRIVVKFRKLR